MGHDDILPAETIERLTGHSRKRPGLQLEELHKQGFWRARRAKVTGAVILERPHYDAIAAGIVDTPAKPNRPQVRVPTLRAAR